MEIREPRYKVGDKVVFDGEIYQIKKLNSYSFCLKEYYYYVETLDRSEILAIIESTLTPYIEKKESRNVYNYTCPNCNTILSEVENCNYCPECGIRLDWSKNE